MDTAARLRIDGWVGRPLVRLGNRLLPAAARLRRRRPQPGRIVVAKFAGLGSILHTTPLLRALAASFPQARVTFATTRPHADLARRLEGVHDVVALEDASLPRLLASGAASLYRLTRPAADLYFDLEPHSALATAVSLLCLPRLRLAQSRSDLPHKASSGACLLEWGPRDRIREVWLELARRAGAHVDAGSELSAPRVTAADRDASRQALAACGMRDATRYLVVNPNASDLRLERRWPAESFAALIAGVAPACPVVLVGTEAERAHVSRVLGGVPEAARAAVFDTSGRLGIGALIALIEGAAAVVSNDSGPMHLGLALGVPTVCLFGPCQPDPYVAPGPRAAVFYERQPCSPCVHAPGPAPCGGDNVCMKAIGVAAVLAATRRLLQA